MDRQALKERLYQIAPKKQLIESAPMSRYTTLRIGGPADFLLEITSAEEIAGVLKAAAELETPITILGNGSNLLVRDGGIRGLVIHLGDGFSHISGPTPLGDGRYALTAQGGAPLIALSNAAAAAGLTGLEFASGIPGTVGGAVYMNAGAYGGEMKDVVTQVTVCMEDGVQTAFSAQEMTFGYRKSLLSRMTKPCAVTSVTVALLPGEEETIRATMREFSARRREKQPLTQPSCGSTFKRPDGYFAGTLIDECGLKGLRVGGASVSTLHAGFLVNDRQGSAADYLALMAKVQQIVWEQKGIRLEPEVRIIGEDEAIRLA